MQSITSIAANRQATIAPQNEQTPSSTQIRVAVERGLFEQAMPIGIVARQPRDLKAEDDPGMTVGQFGQQKLEAIAGQNVATRRNWQGLRGCSEQVMGNVLSRIFEGHWLRRSQ
jgi:hypothetical protein